MGSDPPRVYPADTFDILNFAVSEVKVSAELGDGFYHGFTMHMKREWTVNGRIIRMCPRFPGCNPGRFRTG
jgi:hypothetical protein